jgi:glycosyltransferase involved in cell wall biosynthesis
MRIAFVIPYFYPAMGYGGAPRLAYDMARALTKGGHQVTVLSTDTGGEKRLPDKTVQEIQNNGLDGMRVHFYKNLSNSLAYRQRLFFPMGFFREARAVLQKNEIVHIHDLRSLLAVASHGATRALGIPYVLSPHGGLLRLGKESAKRIFDALWGKAILRDTAALCAISPLEEHDAKTLGIESGRIHPFPPAINADDYRSLPPRGTFASRLGLQDRKIILFLGRLHWIKGADILIEAMTLVPELADLHLVIAGPDDGAENQLRSFVKAKGLERKVTFTGFLDATDKLSALVDSDVVVIPSRREGFPLTVLEALAAQTPVILTSACELGDWIQQQPGLISFRSEDSRDLAQKIKANLCYPPSREVMAEGRKFVINRFSLDAMAERAERLYRSLV